MENRMQSAIEGGHETYIQMAERIAELEQQLAEVTKQAEPVFIVFDGPPDHNAPRFVEVETAGGISVKAGEWKPYGDYWTLGPLFLHPATDDIAALKAEVERLRAALIYERDFDDSCGKYNPEISKNALL